MLFPGLHLRSELAVASSNLARPLSNTKPLNESSRAFLFGKWSALLTSSVKTETYGTQQQVLSSPA